MTLFILLKYQITSCAAALKIWRESSVFLHICKMVLIIFWKEKLDIEHSFLPHYQVQEIPYFFPLQSVYEMTTTKWWLEAHSPEMWIKKYTRAV